MLDFLIGKKIKVKTILRDDRGRKVLGKYSFVEGICEYVGPNKHLGYELQITVGRMPIEINSINDIKLIEE